MLGTLRYCARTVIIARRSIYALILDIKERTRKGPCVFRMSLYPLISRSILHIGRITYYILPI